MDSGCHTIILKAATCLGWPMHVFIFDAGASLLMLTCWKKKTGDDTYGKHTQDTQKQMVPVATYLYCYMFRLAFAAQDCCKYV